MRSACLFLPRVARTGDFRSQPARFTARGRSRQALFPPLSITGTRPLRWIVATSRAGAGGFRRQARLDGFSFLPIQPSAPFHREQLDIPLCLSIFGTGHLRGPGWWRWRWRPILVGLRSHGPFLRGIPSTTAFRLSRGVGCQTARVGKNLVSSGNVASFRGGGVSLHEQGRRHGEVRRRRAPIPRTSWLRKHQ